MLWVLMLAFPFPYIATTAGWMTAELGRQPWLVYGLLRTADGGEPDRACRDGPLHADRILRALSALLGGALPLPDRAGDRPRARTTCRAGRDGPWLRSGSRSSSVMLTTWVVLDGFDFGAGVLHLFVARTDGSAGRCSRPSARSGTATRSGSSPRRGALFLAFPRSSPAGSPASTSRSSSSSGA